jgi:hypothetical protein
MRKNGAKILVVLIAVIVICVLFVFVMPSILKRESADPVPNGSWDETIGYAYIKDFTEDDVAYDGAGIYYVKNQILLLAGNKLTFKDVSKIASQYNADIVGYLEMSNTYQIEIRSDASLEELNRIIAELNENQNISLASLNMVSAVQAEGDGSDTKISYETPENPISLEGYEACAILYLVYGSDNSSYGDVSGVILYADGRAVSYECPSDLEVMYVDETELISDPESLAKTTSLQAPDMETVNNIFALLNEIDPAAAEKVTEDIPNPAGEPEMMPEAEYILWGYYVNQEGEYQRLCLDKKGYAVSNLVDPNAEKITSWFFEQQSEWNFNVYTPPMW